eukprot:gnl/Ergobibamus_cyprinoides/1428.p1 GENE.gnl/Ergobibamus_cyprinoides/1428~~gnl/Ergobibamus_cyprinoides/1428.p1  ORF type:complete len:150 (+),score=26.28 gnl/Ergobibamus_cyprinoides/1428:39-452(+)
MAAIHNLPYDEAHSLSDSGDEGSASDYGPLPPSPSLAAARPARNVEGDVSELFKFIDQYEPHTIQLEKHLKPFVPDLIPAIGDVDPFVKIPRPDGQFDPLGYTVPDEPALLQSDRLPCWSYVFVRSPKPAAARHPRS